MKIIVDANIVFSGILNTNSKIGDLLINSKVYFDFIAPDFLRFETRKHFSKLSRISGMTIEQVEETEYYISKNITFISPEQVRLDHWQSAFNLVSDIDPNDTHYIAYSKHFRCKLWSGDKKLIKGLMTKGYKNPFQQMESIHYGIALFKNKSSFSIIVTAILKTFVRVIVVYIYLPTTIFSI